MILRFWTTVRPALCACAAAGLLVVPFDSANADVLTVFAVGRIDPVCDISVSTPAPTVDFATSGETTADALVNCNTGFVVKATSATGALRNSADAAPGFTNSLTYRLGLTVPLSGSTWISATCGSTYLVAGQSACALSPNGPGLQSGGVPSINQKARLRFSWNTPTKPRLIAGDYQDTITISIAATP